MNYQIIAINNSQLARILVSAYNHEIVSSDRDSCKYSYTIIARKSIAITDNIVNNLVCTFGKDTTNTPFNFNLCNN